MATFSYSMGNLLLSFIKVPNLELLSVIKNLPFWYFIKAWNLETEISLILMSHAWPLPILTVSSEMLWIKKTPFETIFSLDIISRIIYGQEGRSTSIRDFGSPFTIIFFGSGALQISHSKFFFHVYPTVLPVYFLCTFKSNHLFKHSKWTCPKVPAQLQGVMNGFSWFYTSSKKQILQLNF